MCRLAAFPPMFPRESAFRLMHMMAGSQLDGVGSAWVDKGQFVWMKYPLPLETAAKKKMPLFDHMPHPGWTIAHMRQATVGKRSIENTHPFNVGKIVGAHNGGWSKHSLYRRIYEANGIKMAGETDSEVALKVMADLGPKEFKDLVSYDGVFLALTQDGSLWCVKSGWSLNLYQWGGTVVLTTDAVKDQKTTTDVKSGWYVWKPDGKPDSFQVTDYSSYDNTTQRRICGDPMPSRHPCMTEVEKAVTRTVAKTNDIALSESFQQALDKAMLEDAKAKADADRKDHVATQPPIKYDPSLWDQEDDSQWPNGLKKDTFERIGENRFRLRRNPNLHIISKDAKIKVFKDQEKLDDAKGRTVVKALREESRMKRSMGDKSDEDYDFAY